MPTQVIARPKSEPQESQVSIILEILADGSAKDVVSVSNELEKKGNFADINQVRSVCEKLIQQGRLERVGEGEFFAQYRLRTVASAQSTSPWLRPPLRASLRTAKSWRNPPILARSGAGLDDVKAFPAITIVLLS